jgi:hypothetical protein
VDRGHSLKSPTHGLIARARRSGAIGSDRLNLRTASPGGGGSVPCRRAARQARARRRKPRHCPLDLAIKRSRLQDAERENRPWFSTSSRYQAQPLSIISSIRSLSMSIASCPIGAHASRRVAHDRCGKNRAPSNPWNHASIRHRAVVPRCQHQGDRPGASPRFGPASAVSFARQSIGGPLTDARDPEGVVAQCQDRRRDPRAGDEKVFLSCVKALRPDIIVVARRCSRLPQNCSCLPPKARRCGQGIFMGLTMPSP